MLRKVNNIHSCYGFFFISTSVQLYASVPLCSHFTKLVERCQLLIIRAVSTKTFMINFVFMEIVLHFMIKKHCYGTWSLQMTLFSIFFYTIKAKHVFDLTTNKTPFCYDLLLIKKIPIIFCCVMAMVSQTSNLGRGGEGCHQSSGGEGEYEGRRSGERPKLLFHHYDYCSIGFHGFGWD